METSQVLHVYRTPAALILWNAAILSPLVIPKAFPGEHDGEGPAALLARLERNPDFAASALGRSFIASSRDATILSYEPPPPSISYFYLIVTRRCNLRCEYCFVLDRDSTHAFGTDNIRRLVRWSASVLRTETRKPTFVLYGGEPLLALDATRAAIDEVRELTRCGSLPVSTQVVLITNGTLVTRTVAEYLAASQTIVFVSLDGRPTSHDQYRRSAGGGSTSAAALRGFRRLQQAGVRPGLSITITDANLPTLVEDLKSFILPLGPAAISYNIPRTHDAVREVAGVRVDGRALADALFDAYLICRDHGIRESRSARIIEPILEGRVRSADCAACGQQLTFYFDGTVTPCHMLDEDSSERVASVGNPISAELIANNPVLRRWSRYSPRLNPECATCPAVGCCGGGCRILFTNERHRAYQQMYCDYVRRMVERTVVHVAESALEHPA